MTTQTNGDELERQNFEKWWSTQRAVVQRARMGSVTGPYRSKAMQKAWEAWQAALSSKQEEP